MHFYGFDYQKVMDLPIKTFWAIDRQINRVRAEADLRAMRVSSSSMGGEGAQTLQETLLGEMGEPIRLDPIKSAIRDKAGVEDLRRMNQ